MNEKKGSDEEKATDEESSEQGTISNLASDIQWILYANIPKGVWLFIPNIGVHIFS